MDYRLFLVPVELFLEVQQQILVRLVVFFGGKDTETCFDLVDHFTIDFAVDGVPKGIKFTVYFIEEFLEIFHLISEDIYRSFCFTSIHP